MMELVDAETKRFPGEDSLRQRFSEALDRPATVTYGGAGIAAPVGAFLLHRLGRPDAAVYDGSLSEWSADPTLPMAA